MNTPSKERIIRLLDIWISQRPRLEWCNYATSNYRESLSAYRSESRRITRQLQDARKLLRAVELSGITAEELMRAFNAFSGRLQLVNRDLDEWQLEYCTGQYWPTEYRAAACAVLASALWDYHRPDCKDGDAIRAKFRRMFGASIQKRWFD